MSFSKLSSIQLQGLEAHIVDIEVDISRGLNAFSIVGLPDKAIEEAKDRISAAIKNSGYDSPKSKNHKITIALAPAELRKEGSNFDLPMAVAYLLSIGELSFDPRKKIFIGELSLDGTLRRVKGALSLVTAAKKKGIQEIFLPHSNAEEVCIIDDVTLFAVTHLKDVIAHFTSTQKLSPLKIKPLQITERKIEHTFYEIKGQENAKRALEIAAAGGHNIMLYGPPGTGKTLLARAFPALLPELSFDEKLEVTTLHSSAGIDSGIISFPPFRAPHHNATSTSMVGGGAYPKPGEVTLAHRGVLFMDEFPEFNAHIIELLRQPLEDKKVSISRTKHSIVFPSDFILLASMNPCPCGYKGSIGSVVKKCICTHAILEKYRRKISGPIIDRFDMWVEVSDVEYKKLGLDGFDKDDQGVDSTKSIQKRVKKVRELRQKREKEAETGLFLSKSVKNLLDSSAETLGLSARMYHKIIRLSRTIADLEDKKDIEESHVLEAFQYRFRL